MSTQWLKRAQTLILFCVYNNNIFAYNNNWKKKESEREEEEEEEEGKQKCKKSHTHALKTFWIYVTITYNEIAAVAAALFSSSFSLSPHRHLLCCCLAGI
jgi:hypothetical protein